MIEPSKDTRALVADGGLLIGDEKEDKNRAPLFSTQTHHLNENAERSRSLSIVLTAGLGKFGLGAIAPYYIQDGDVIRSERKIPKPHDRNRSHSTYDTGGHTYIIIGPYIRLLEAVFDSAGAPFRSFSVIWSTDMYCMFSM